MSSTVIRDKSMAASLVSRVLHEAINMGASDVHFVPVRNGARVKYRVSGQISAGELIPFDHYNSIVNRIKVLSDLSTVDHRIVQEGHMILTEFDNTSRHMRVSVIPTSLGERIAIRIFWNDESFFSLTQLGMDSNHANYYAKLAFCNQGLVLIAGPTGCGKTTTLYSSVLALNTESLSVISIEDPVECIVDGISQVNLQTTQNLSYGKAIKASLRQDPDVIVIGEIRDKEAALSALEASLSGHLVLATIHAFDTVTALSRLVSFGIEPSILASSLNCVIAQRLVQRLCPKCKTETSLTERQIQFINTLVSRPLEHTWRSQGCSFCEGKGYMGRTGIFEIMPMSTELRNSLGNLPNVQPVMRAALSAGMEPLILSGIRKAIDGETTLNEIMSIFQLRREVEQNDFA